MIEVSELAATAMVQSLCASNVPSGQGFRLRKREDKFSLEIDSPTENDRVIRHEEAIVLIVDPGVEDEVGDVVIDVQEMPDGHQLMMHSRSSQE
jgi:hypothetical protein